MHDGYQPMMDRGISHATGEFVKMGQSRHPLVFVVAPFEDNNHPTGNLLHSVLHCTTPGPTHPRLSRRSTTAGQYRIDKIRACKSHI